MARRLDDQRIDLQKFSSCMQLEGSSPTQDTGTDKPATTVGGSVQTKLDDDDTSVIEIVMRNTETVCTKKHNILPRKPTMESKQLQLIIDEFAAKRSTMSNSIVDFEASMVVNNA